MSHGGITALLWTQIDSYFSFINIFLAIYYIARLKFQMQQTQQHHTTLNTSKSLPLGHSGLLCSIIYCITAILMQLESWIHQHGLITIQLCTILQKISSTANYCRVCSIFAMFLQMMADHFGKTSFKISTMKLKISHGFNIIVTLIAIIPVLIFNNSQIGDLYDQKTHEYFYICRFLYNRVLVIVALIYGSSICFIFCVIVVIFLKKCFQLMEWMQQNETKSFNHRVQKILKQWNILFARLSELEAQQFEAPDAKNTDQHVHKDNEQDEPMADVKDAQTQNNIARYQQKLNDLTNKLYQEAEPPILTSRLTIIMIRHATLIIFAISVEFIRLIIQFAFHIQVNLGNFPQLTSNAAVFMVFPVGDKLYGFLFSYLTQCIYNQWYWKYVGKRNKWIEQMTEKCVTQSESKQSLNNINTLSFSNLFRSNPQAQNADTSYVTAQNATANTVDEPMGTRMSNILSIYSENDGYNSEQVAINDEPTATT